MQCIIFEILLFWTMRQMCQICQMSDQLTRIVVFAFAFDFAIEDGDDNDDDCCMWCWEHWPFLWLLQIVMVVIIMIREDIHKKKHIFRALPELSNPCCFLDKIMWYYKEILSIIIIISGRESKEHWKRLVPTTSCASTTIHTRAGNFLSG